MWLGRLTMGARKRSGQVDDFDGGAGTGCWTKRDRGSSWRRLSRASGTAVGGNGRS
jgi:hypothetical protein